MKKWLLVVIGLVGAFLATMYFGDDQQRYLAFFADPDAWHRKCDVYIGKPATTPAAKACAEELDAFIAYAKRQGWDR